MNLTAEREAHLRYLAGIDDAMRDAMGMLDRARSERVMYARALLRLLEATGAALDLDAQAVARADEPHGLEPRAAADAPQRHDGGGLGDLTAGRADVGDGLGGEGGHGEDGST